MKLRPGRFASLALLAACVAAALVFRRFVFVAWYPVAMSAAVSLGFGLSLFRRKTLCEEIAEKVPPHILPDGAEAYCRRLTAFWCAALAVNGAVATATVFGPRWTWFAWNCALSYVVLWSIAGVEWLFRRRRFAAVFHTSGSTSAPKTIVKAFPTLAKEVAFHLGRLRAEGILPQPGGKGPLFLSTVEPDHMYGLLWRKMLPKAAGCVVDEEVIRAPESLVAKMKSAEGVFLVTTPSFLERFSAYAGQYDVPRNCVEIVTSGALLTADAAAAARRVFGRAPLEIFGSTETGGVAWRRQFAAAQDAFDWTVFAPVKARQSPDGRLVVSSPFSCARNYVMGDGVEFAPGGRRFKLLGRRDRLVKINEQRVSLPEMEAKMAELPEVREAALAALDGPHGPFLGAVVVLAEGAPFPGKRAAAMALRSKLLAIFPKGTVPKKYRFVYELPRNAQGKVRVEELRRTLSSDFAEPHVENAACAADSWSADLTFDADAMYFQGHFPGFPILPGVVQLGTAHHFAEAFVRRSLRLKEVKKLKFQRIIHPGEKVGFTVERKSDSEYAFRYAVEGGVCSSGTMVVESPPPAMSAGM